MKCKLVNTREVTGTQGKGLALTLVVESYRPLKHNEANVTKGQVAVLDGNEGADLLEFRNDSEKERPVFEQLSSFFSTIQPIELQPLLRPGDFVDFEPQSFWTTEREGQTYINMRGNINLSSNQISRMVHQQTQAQSSSKEVKVNVSNKAKTVEVKGNLDF